MQQLTQLSQKKIELIKKIVDARFSKVELKLLLIKAKEILYDHKSK